MSTNDRICPLNDHACRCDPDASDKKLHPCVLAKRITKFVRLMGSSFEGEAIGAVVGLRRLLQTEELSFNDLATLIENCNGRIEEKKYSDDDALNIFTRGVEKGLTEAARKEELPPEFYNIDGEPRWYDIATFCQKNSRQQKNGAPLLSDWDQEFISDMPSKMVKYGKPTPKQIPYLLAIFVTLGGYYDGHYDAARHVHR
jgi:hypothetical protein